MHKTNKMASNSQRRRVAFDSNVDDTTTPRPYRGSYSSQSPPSNRNQYGGAVTERTRPVYRPDDPKSFFKNIELPLTSAFLDQKGGLMDNVTDMLGELSDVFGRSGPPQNRSSSQQQTSKRNTNGAPSSYGGPSQRNHAGANAQHYPQQLQQNHPQLLQQQRQAGALGGFDKGCGGCDDDRCPPPRGNFDRYGGYSVRTSGCRDDCCGECDGDRGRCNNNSSCVPPDMVVPIAEPKCTPTLIVPYGFVASMLEIDDVALLPFVLTPTSDCTLDMTPNAPLFTAEDLADAIGISVSTLPGLTIPFCAMLPTLVLLSNLPGTYAQYNGLYILVSDSPLRLLRLEWVHDPCAPNVGSMIELLYGSTASVWDISEINDNCQTIAVVPTGIKYLKEYSIKHMQTCKPKCKQYYEVTTCAPRTPCWT